MKCAVHSEVDATGYCRNCGKALCPQCTREVRGVLYCEECLATLVSKPQPAPGAGSPTLAAILGFVPGLGAVYNGEYLKALVHVVIFAGLIAMLNSSPGEGYEVLYGLLLTAFIFYMPIDAHRTAKAKALGMAPPAALGTTGAPGAASTNWMVGPAILIGLGVLFLLVNLGLLRADWLGHYWPVILIVVGGWLLWKRTRKPV